MNAATVSGPRSRITSAMQFAFSNSQSSFFLDGHEDFLVAAPDAQLREAAALDLLQLPRGFDGVRDRLAVDAEDHVALGQGARRRPVLIHIGHHGAGSSG